MFDFIKRIFRSKSEQGSSSHDVADMDVVEGNNIEVIKTSDYSEGVPADAVEQFVAEQELPPRELDLPAAELDEPTDEPDMPIDIDMEEPDNYLLGDLKAAKKQRDMQTRKAGMQYWSDAAMKYRPRRQRPAVDGTNAKQFNYFDVLRDEPMLRKVELEHPGMNIDQLNLERFVNNSLKGKMVNEFILKSMKFIRDQQENGMPPVWNRDLGTADGSSMRDMNAKTLRDMFNAYESQRIAAKADSLDSAPILATMKDDYDGESDRQIAELLENFEEMFSISNASEDSDENTESYTRWLMSVAEEADASEDILWMLAEDPNPDVRFCLAENYNIDTNILKKLSEDENPYVAHRAQKTMMRMQKSANGGQLLDRSFGNGETHRYRKSG